MSKNINGGTINFKTNLDVSNLKKKLSDLKTQINTIEKQKVNIKVNVTADTKKAKSDIEQLNKLNNKKTINVTAETQKAKSDVEQLVKNSNASLKLELGDVALDFGEKIGNALSGVFDKYFPELYNTSKQHSQNLTDIYKLEGYTKKDKDKLNDKSVELATKYGLDVTDVSSALINAAQADIKVLEKSGEDFATTIAKFTKNTHGEISTEDATTLISRIEKGYNGRYSAEDITDKILATTDKGNIKSKDIITYAGKAYASASALNLDLNQVNGYIAAASGVANPEEILTALNNMLTEVKKTATNTNLNGKIKEATGEDGYKKLKEEGLYAFLDLVEITANKLGTDNVGSVFSNSRSMFGGDIYATQKEKMLEYTDYISESKGLLNEQVGKQMEDPFVTVDTSLTNIKTLLVDAIMPALATILPVIAQVISAIPPELLTGLTIGILSLGAASKVITPIAILVFTLKNLNGVLGILGGAGSLGGIISLLSNPIFWVIGGIITSLVILFTNWDNIMAGLKITLEFIVDLIKGIVGFVWELITGIGELIIKALELSAKLSPLGLLSTGIGFVKDKISGANTQSYGGDSNTTTTYNVNNYVTMSGNGDIDTFNRKLFGELRSI